MARNFLRSGYWLGLLIIVGFIRMQGALPAAPANVRPAWVDAVSSVLTWDDSEEADSFNVYRFDPAGETWTQVGSQILVPFFREASGQEPPLAYAVTAVNSSGESLFSTVTIESGGFPDFYVSIYDPNWFYQVTRTSATLMVAASPVSGVDAVLELGTTLENTEFVEYHPEYQGFHTFTVTNLTPGTQYYYRYTLTGTNRLGMSVMQAFYTLPANIRPEVYPVTFEWNEDGGPAYISPNAYDPDLYGPAEFRIVTQPAHGTVVAENANGYYLIYTPETNYFGTDTFTYTLFDGEEEAVPATVTITVHPVNDQGWVETASLELSTLAGVPVHGSVVVTDGDDDPHTLVVASFPQFGYVVIDGTNFFYYAEPGASGIASFSLYAADQYGNYAANSTLVTVNVTAVNQPPAAVEEMFYTSEDRPLEIQLIGTDGDGDPLSYTLVDLPEHGTLTGVPPQLVYTPDENYNGPDGFSFRVSDGQADSPVANIAIEVVAEDDLPVPQNMAITTVEDTGIDITLQATDIDGGTVFWAVQQPAHGTLTGTPPFVRYTPNQNYFGPDSFGFTSQANASPVTHAQVQITVQPVDDAPVAQPQNVTAIEDTSTAVALGVVDVDGGAADFQIVAAPVHGSLSGDAPNMVYTPAPNYSGTDSFTFSVRNGTATPSEATVHIQISGVNDAPVAQSTAAQADEDGAIICPIVVTDVEGDGVTFTIVRPPEHGSLGAFGSAPYIVHYLPAANFYGTDSFDLQASDGTAVGNVFTITVQISPVDDAPVALAQTLTMQEDTSLPVTLSASDIDGGPLTWEIVSLPAIGTLIGTPPNLIYTPTANYAGEDQIVFAAGSSEAIITIQVAPVNDAPVATPKNVTTAYNSPVGITLSGTDVDSASLSYTVLSSPSNGVLSGTAPNLTFTPNTAWSGTTSFSFRVSDGQLTSTATVSITVQSTSTVPASPNGLTAQAVSRSQINLSWNDNSNNEDGFKIERSTGGSYTQIATVGPNVRSFSNTGLSSNRSYSYRVRAFNVRGNSGYSNTATAKTLK